MYSPEKIDELSGKVRIAAEQTMLLFAFFNNHWQGYAPRNAVSMMKTLKLPFKEPPIQVQLPDDDKSEM